LKVVDVVVVVVVVVVVAAVVVDAHRYEWGTFFSVKKGKNT